MKNRLRDLGQDRRGGVVVEIDHHGDFSPHLRQSKVQGLESRLACRRGLS